MNKKWIKRPQGAKKTEDADRPADAPGRRRIPARLAGILLAVVGVIFLIYSMVSLIGIRSKIQELRGDLSEITDDIANQERKNEEMLKIASQSGDELNDYMEQIAHDQLDLVREGEKIYIVVAGD